MRKVFGLLLLASLVSVGCKKNEPEAPTGPAVDVTAERIVIIRGEADGPVEQATFRGVLSVTNGYSGDIVLKKVDFEGSLGQAAVEPQSKELDFSLSPGATTELKLDAPLPWKADAPVTAERGTVSGTLHFRGPAGNPQQVDFRVDAAVQERGGE